LTVPKISISPTSNGDSGKIQSDREHKRVDIQCQSDPAKILNQVENALDQDRLVCWIANTVENARERYRDLVSGRDEDDVTLLHSRFALGDRYQLERQVHKWAGPNSEQEPGLNSYGEPRSGRCIIATQVLEQSMDIDADLMVTELAPIDRIIQRIGRLHRHSRKRQYNPELIVHAPPETDSPDKNWYRETLGKAEYVYRATHRLWLTAEILYENDTLAFPEDTPRLINRVDERAQSGVFPEVFNEAYSEFNGDEIADKQTASMNAFCNPDLSKGYGVRGEEYSAIPTRLGPDSRLLRLIAPGDQKWSYPEVRDWAAGNIRIRKNMIARPDYSAGERKRVKKLIQIMDDCYSYEQDPDGWGSSIGLLLLDENYETSAFDQKGNDVNVTYSTTEGLSVQ